MNREEDFKMNIRRDIEIPDIVMEKAHEAFAVIKKDSVKSKKKFSHKQIAAAVASVVVLAAASLHPIVQAGIKSLSYDIARGLGAKKDLSPYKTVVNQSVSDGSVTITLNEVILDGNELIISTTETYPEKSINDYMSNYSAQVIVNGKVQPTLAFGTEEKIDDNNVGSIMTYRMDGMDSEELLDVELTFIKNNSLLPISNMKFAFSTSGAELSQSTIKTPMDETIVLEDGTSFTAYELTRNALGEKIYMNINKSTDTNYDIKLTGKDNLGNDVEFYMALVQGNEILLKTDLSLESRLSDSAESITLTPYAVDLPEKGDKMNFYYQQVGDSFTISLR